jgi:hypothetical protein
MGFALGGSFVWAISIPNHGRSDNQSQLQTSPAAVNKNEPRETFWQRATEDPTAFFTLCVAAFTLVLAASTIALWIETRLAGRRQSRHMEALVNETRRIGEAQVRAYVSIQSAAIAFWGPWEHPIVVFVPFNTGQSPATNFIWNITIQYASGHDKRTHSFIENWQSNTGVNIDIPAAQTAPPQRAVISHIPLKNFRGILDKTTPRGVVVRVRIDFRFTDVFERDWFGECYFAGLGPQAAPAPEVGVEMPKEMTALEPSAKPKDWD